MCGIAGFLANGERPPGSPDEILDEMAASLVHRGPDDSGTYWDSGHGIGLAHRRLSIQDLSPAGAQPMTSASGRYVIVFNGEIYNFRALAAQLQTCGARFRGHCDTEVMLAAFERWGVEASLQRFAGMFAFAVLDRRGRRLWLARDRMGEKPLYYGWHGGSFLFASELKALQRFPRFAPPIDRDALTLLLRHNFIPAPHTIYSGVFKLPPAHVLCIPLKGNGRAAEPRPYWSLSDACRETPGWDLGTAADELERRLGVVVEEQMVADVPLGAFLSGGVDSSAVVALMQQRADQPVRTFSIGFDEPGYNEAEYAAAVARHLETRHTELYVTGRDALEVIPRLPELYDEPFADSSQIPTFLISRMTRGEVTVALSGDGGDELFAGYPRYQNTLAGWRRRRGQAGMRSRMEDLLLQLPDALAVCLVRLLSRGQRGLSAQGIREKLRRERGLRTARDLPAYYARSLSYWAAPEMLVPGARIPSYALTDDLPGGIAAQPALRQLQWLDLNWYLPDDILTKVDRAAMSVGLETRIPLLDHRIVEFALGLHSGLQIDGGMGKQVLRTLLYRHVPKHLIERPKQGFAVPLGRWLRTELREWAEDLLKPSSLRAEGFWNVAMVRRTWRDHLMARDDYSFQLWGILMFQSWLHSQKGMS